MVRILAWRGGARRADLPSHSGGAAPSALSSDRRLREVATKVSPRPPIPRRAALLALLMLILGACAPLRPWERGELAHRLMRPDVSARVEARKALLHVLWAREASVGAVGQAGGGCGCN